MAPAAAHRGQVAPRTGRGSANSVPLRGSDMRCRKRIEELPRWAIPVSTRYGVAQPRRLDDPQGELEGREAAAMHFYILGGHADRRRGLQQRIGKSVNKGGEGETPEFVEIGRLDPAARAKNGAGHRPRLGARLRRRPFPSRQPPLDHIAPFGRQKGGRHLPHLLDPCHPVAVRRNRRRDARAAKAGSIPIAALST